MLPHLNSALLLPLVALLIVAFLQHLQHTLVIQDSTWRWEPAKTRPGKPGKGTRRLNNLRPSRHFVAAEQRIKDGAAGRNRAQKVEEYLATTAGHERLPSAQ